MSNYFLSANSTGKISTFSSCLVKKIKVLISRSCWYDHDSAKNGYNCCQGDLQLPAVFLNVFSFVSITKKKGCNVEKLDLDKN